MWLSVDTELAQEKTASVGGGREATGARRPRGQLSRGGEGGASWLSQTPEEPLRGATFRAAAASLEPPWQRFVLRQTFLLSVLPTRPSCQLRGVPKLHWRHAPRLATALRVSDGG